MHDRRLFIASVLAIGLLIPAGLAPSASGVTARTPKPTATPAPTALTFAGRTWRIKRSSSLVGPGPNRFSASGTWVDSAGALHLRIAKDGSGRWQSAEVYLPASLGYGIYTWTVASRVDALDPNVVLGLFTYETDTREIDIEMARWGDPSDPTNAQYVVQPWDLADHLIRFTQPPIATSIHRFTWSPGHVTYESRSPDGSWTTAWSHASADVPPPGGERVHMNLWLYGGHAPTSGRAAEVVIGDFSFVPLP
jgi:hypothetical protein